MSLRLYSYVTILVTLINCYKYNVVIADTLDPNILLFWSSSEFRYVRFWRKCTSDVFLRLRRLDCIRHPFCSSHAATCTVHEGEVDGFWNRGTNWIYNTDWIYCLIFSASPRYNFTILLPVLFLLLTFLFVLFRHTIIFIPLIFAPSSTILHAGPDMDCCFTRLYIPEDSCSLYHRCEPQFLPSITLLKINLLHLQFLNC